MRFLPFLLFFTLNILGQSDEYRDRLNTADSLLMELHVDSTIAILEQLDKNKDRSISFRLDVLNTIISDKTYLEKGDEIEKIIKSYQDEAISDMVRVTYLNYFSETLIPENEYNEYNLELLNDILEIYDNSSEQDSFLRMHLLHNKGNLLYELSRHKEAIPYLEEALEISSKIDTRNPSLYGIILFNLANPYYFIGKYQKSYELVEKSEKHLSSLEKPNLDYLQTVYLDLFSTSLDFDYMEKAEKYLQKSERLYYENKLAITNGNQKLIAEKECTLLYNFMHLYRETGNYQKAEETLEAALKSCGFDESEYFRLRLAAIYNYMGEMYVIEKPEKSFQYYRKAIDIFNNEENLAYSLMFEFNLGKAYLNSGQYAEVAKIATSIIEKGESIDDRRLPFFYFLEVKRMLKQGRFEESLVPLNKIANSVNTSDIPIDLVSQKGVRDFFREEDIDFAYLISGIATEIEQHTKPSRTSMLVMNSLWQMAIANFRDAFKTIGFNEKSRREYEIMMHGLLRTDQYLGKHSIPTAEVIKFSENANSRSLWEQFKTKNEGLVLLDESLLTEEQTIRSNIISLKKKLMTPDSSEIKREIFEQELALERLEEEKRKKNHSFYSYEEFDFNVETFQANLNSDELVIKYEFLDSILYRFNITSSEIEIYPLDSITVINDLVSRFTEAIREPSSSNSEIYRLGRELYQLLLPVDLPTRLYFISDGSLNYLPYDLLVKDQDFLLKNHIISYASSLALLDPIEVDNTITNAMIMAPSYDQYILSKQQLAVRGEPYNLQGALQEAEAVSAIIPNKKWTGSEATKQRFVTDAPGYDLLHLSMHSFMNDDDPELSSLVFHDADHQNELYVSELYGMNLNAKLAVLSACNTGVGVETTGDGIVSVNRAFTYAGVPSVVSSLWSAPDQATKDLMTLFYSEMKSGKDKATALRNAKLAYLENQNVDQLKHPYFWAGFVLHGNPEALSFKSSALSLQVIVFAMVIILAVVLLIFYNQRKKLKST